MIVNYWIGLDWMLAMFAHVFAQMNLLRTSCIFFPMFAKCHFFLASFVTPSPRSGLDIYLWIVLIS